MPTPITMPQLAETVTEGTISKWMKSVGETVKRYEPLAEIMTDKVNVEMTSPVTGVLVEILAAEGDTIPVGALMANIAEAGEEGPPSPSGARPASGEGEDHGEGEGDLPHVGSAPPAIQTNGRANRQRLTPVVARLAAQHNIDVSNLTGTGIDGRVTKQDLLRYIETRSQSPTAAQLTPTTAQPRGDGASARERERSSVSGPDGTHLSLGRDDEPIPVTPLRRAIAENMVRSKTTAPHAWAMTEVDVTNLVRWREGIKEDFKRREGVDLTYLPFFVKAAAEALKEHPGLNASWGETQVLLKKHINIGLAVDRPDGLIVPVIKDADRLSVSGLAHAIADIVTRARNNNLKPEDVAGGTFTLNNTGALGVTLSYPILVPGQAAILTTEAIVKRPVVIDDAIAIRSMMNIAIAFDHRITDGGVIGSFLRMVKMRLQALGPDTSLG